MIGEFWCLGQRVLYDTRNKHGVILGNIVGFPKVHNSALARVKFDKFKREKVVPLELLVKVDASAEAFVNSVLDRGK